MKFPKTLYVVQESETRDCTHWFEAASDPKGFAVIGGTRQVAIYKLERVAKLRNESTLE